MVPLMRNFGLYFFSCLALGGCAGPRIEPNGTVTRIAAEAFPKPERVDALPDRPYYLGPLDQLAIDVVGMPELQQRDIQVDASGRISFPMVGTIQVAGKTPVEAAELIEQGLRASFFRNPQVAVNLKSTVSQIVTVEGQVNEPGLYPVVGNMTLLRAVASAKGTSELASLDDVVILRTVGGKKYAALYNLTALRRGAYEDPEIYANDVVVVGDSAARRRFRDLLTVIPLVSTPLILLLQGN